MFDATKHLCDALIARQVRDESSPDFGGILCPRCGIAHARAGEAVFPLSYFYSETREKKYLDAGLRLMLWLAGAQEDDGSWGRAAPEATTVFVTTALGHSHDLVVKEMKAAERERLEQVMRGGAEYLYRNASLEWAEKGEPGVNCFLTSCPALHVAGDVLGEEKYKERAKENALAGMGRFNEEGFLLGEGAGSQAVGRPGVDVARDLEIGLGALVLYSCLSGNEEAREAARKALETHLHFITPSGYIDDSWGERVSEWMLLGNVAGSGCQTAFLPLRNTDARYQRAAGQNLRFLLKNMLKDGLVTTGPHAKDNPEYVSCIVPTVARVKAASYGLIYSCGVPLCLSGKSLLPTEEKGWVRLYRTVNVLQVRTSSLLCTITGYGGAPSNDGEGTRVPGGGTISHLWHERFGTVQAASCAGSAKARAPSLGRSVGCLTPRIEAEIGGEIFSNVYDPDAAISVSEQGMIDDRLEARVTGRLKSAKGEDPQLEYSILYRFDGEVISKEMEVRGVREAQLRSVEPMVFGAGCDLLSVEKGIEIRSAGGSSCILRASGESTTIRTVSRQDAVWNELPGLYALPIVIEGKGTDDAWKIGYRIELQDWE